ncbi:hypothetical protein HAX54_030996, partial [Datura stramonium]|nr:hypothetical protein [Datura stramonium]
VYRNTGLGKNGFRATALILRRIIIIKDCEWWLTDKFLVENSLTQCSAHYQRFIGGPQITSYGSPKFRR